VFGVDRVLFSVDYPFGANAAGRALLDALPISPADKAKVAGLNAERLLRLTCPGDLVARAAAERPGSQARWLRWAGWPRCSSRAQRRHQAARADVGRLLQMPGWLGGR
jgi:hypothetical protein